MERLVGHFLAQRRMAADELEDHAVGRAQHFLQRQAAAGHPALVALGLHALVLLLPQGHGHEAGDALQLLFEPRAAPRAQKLDQHAFAVDQQQVIGVEVVESLRSGFGGGRFGRVALVALGSGLVSLLSHGLYLSSECVCF
ncbi:hypothetical protein D9M69_458390 [compost metagenome]